MFNIFEKARFRNAGQEADGDTLGISFRSSIKRQFDCHYIWSLFLRTKLLNPQTKILVKAAKFQKVITSRMFKKNRVTFVNVHVGIQFSPLAQIPFKKIGKTFLTNCPLQNVSFPDNHF